MRFGIVAFPSKTLQDKANSYRMRYDTRYSHIPPHVTLKPVFELDEKDFDQLHKQITEVANKHEPFEMKVSRVGTFHPVNNVVYFKIERSDKINALHDELNDGTLHRDEDYAFVPHITIGQDMSDDELFDVFERLKMTSFDYNETIDRFHLCYQLENGSWTVAETYHLTSKGLRADDC
ncbi:YjcG family protein [Aureibacillus halotolerans]|uniref:Putative phosphoesterase EV213_102185 n=1 Tax=Aureibacillus halotolerans TaxID=1508390 RepID=A0A4R6UBM8_9BACI|nr:YjcG family protein [Aureibacillus halotolerans]TDQ42155.1 2'-5' RNA ligase [Aureibacillus halotolerans]